jgi:tungstate transport system substrate-binding protein
MTHHRVFRMLRPAAALGLLLVAAPGALAGQSGRDVILATTTSTYDTGLLDSLMPRFEKECGCRVKTVAVGSGAALALAGRGEADLVLAHAPALELKYVSEGKLTNRRLVMSNDFVVVGPSADPGGLKAAATAAEAFRRLAADRAPFISRGDSSGTNLLELAQWRTAGIAPSGAWYLQSGQGMGATLQIASEKRAYTLTDRGTYLALRDKLDLAIVFEGAPELLNIYHVLEADSASHPGVNVAGGQALAAFFLRQDVQDFIRTFGVATFGQPLFVPRAGQEEPR